MRVRKYYSITFWYQWSKSTRVKLIFEEEGYTMGEEGYNMGQGVAGYNGKVKEKPLP